MGPHFDTAFKLKVVSYYNQVRNKYRAGQMFGVSECSVRQWIKKEPQLRATGPSPKRLVGGVRQGAGALSLLENGLKRFVERCHRRGARARYPDLVAYATQLKKVLKVRGVQISLDWVRNFVRRERLVTRCQKLKSAPDHSTPKKKKAAGKAAAQKKGTPPPRGGVKGLSRAQNSVKSAAAKFLERAKKLQAKKKTMRGKPPLKRLKPRKSPTKVFRTRYRIKEMHRRIEENRASDFFDFFYGLGLIPVNRSRDDSLCIPPDVRNTQDTTTTLASCVTLAALP
ncbi:hypothetical protein IscW_ISCW020511 [Ixodes scapularis]|uniref:Brinker DNA-binding domain-containing protein n=1 Tax=Ixodes scapularis TaxID=6945 RepID=B7Q1F2_IXOSC|nr:hypothetical protein IscW_ISCW020511 [Ixodes scapularis]|eukprot:XP_002409591.1 hypothetical protein IscW_ISCW020511 [Ixodes scapularis]